MRQLLFWIKLATYNSSIWIEFAFKTLKKSIWVIHQLFRALNAIVQKFAVHPVKSLIILPNWRHLPPRTRRKRKSCGHFRSETILTRYFHCEFSFSSISSLLFQSLLKMRIRKTCQKLPRCVRCCTTCAWKREKRPNLWQHQNSDIRLN